MSGSSSGLSSLRRSGRLRGGHRSGPAGAGRHPGGPGRRGRPGRQPAAPGPWRSSTRSSRCTRARSPRSRPACGPGISRTRRGATAIRRGAAWAAAGSGAAGRARADRSDRDARSGSRPATVARGGTPSTRSLCPARGFVVWFRARNVWLVSTRPVTGRCGFGRGGPPRRRDGGFGGGGLGRAFPARSGGRSEPERFVCGVDLGHLARRRPGGRAVAAGQVGVVPAGQTAPRRLDLRRRCVALDTEDIVRVALRHQASVAFDPWGPFAGPASLPRSPRLRSRSPTGSRSSTAAEPATRSGVRRASCRPTSACPTRTWRSSRAGRPCRDGGSRPRRAPPGRPCCSSTAGSRLATGPCRWPDSSMRQASTS